LKETYSRTDASEEGKEGKRVTSPTGKREGKAAGKKNPALIDDYRKRGVECRRWGGKREKGKGEA